MQIGEDRRLHDLMNVAGIRAPLTAAAVIQLIKELLRAGVLDDGAVERIKEAVIRQAALGRRPHLSQVQFEAEFHILLANLFAEGEPPV